MQVIYIVYLKVVEERYIFLYSIYLGLLILVLLFDRLIQKKESKKNYLVELLYFSLYINLFIEPALFSLIILLTFLISLWSKVIKIVNQKANLQSIDEEKEIKKIPIGCYMGISTILIVLIQNFTCYWR